MITLRPRQDRGEASKRLIEAEAELSLPRGEASASRHTTLEINNILQSFESYDQVLGNNMSADICKWNIEHRTKTMCTQINSLQ